MGNPSDPDYQTDELLKEAVGNPSVEEWADWIVHRYNFCERNAGESLREIALVALRNVASKGQQGIVTKPLNSGGLVVRQCKACYATYHVRDGHACPELLVSIPSANPVSSYGVGRAENAVSNLRMDAYCLVCNAVIKDSNPNMVGTVCPNGHELMWE